MTGIVFTSIAVGVLLLGSGMLVVSIARRAAGGQLERNGWAGIRTTATRSSDGAWAAAHQTAERPTVVGGWLMALAGLISVPIAALFANGDPDLFGLVWSLALLALSTPAVAAIVYGAIIGHRAAKAHD